ncbi:MAG: glycosyltransferase family 39 protein [Pyrinomonadaceae bacterium]|nr:glycosyltransferase family 39 protein [Pyrinomonadaceae bacterium]
MKIVLPLVLAIVFYVFVRLSGAADSCLFFDEVFSVHAATLDWKELFWFVAQDLIHPPLFYVLLKIWISIGGESLIWLRLFSVFWVTLAILPFVMLSRELNFTNFQTLIALILIAANGSLIKYAQEVRMYGVLFCFALFSIWIFARYLHSKSSVYSLFAVNVLLVHTHYFGWLIVFSQLCVVCVFGREKLKSFAVHFVSLILIFGVWIRAVILAKAQNELFAQNLGWAGKPNLSSLWQLFLSLHEPFYFQKLNIEPTNLLLISIPIALICATAIFLMLWRKSSDKAQTDKSILILAFFVVAPVSVAFVASWILPYSIWGMRHLTIVFAPYFMIAAVAISRTHKILVAPILILIVVGGIFHFTREKPAFIYCAWENLAEKAVESDEKDAVKIYAFEDLVAYHLWFATRNDARLKVIAIKDAPEMPEDKAYFLPRGFDSVQIADESVIDGERFWLAFRDKKFDANKPLFRELTAKGYRFKTQSQFDANGTTAFLILAEKGE